jgi:hypothetical protein
VPLDPLKLLTLDASMQSPEAPHTICAEMQKFLGKPVTESEVLQAFRALEALGLVQEHGRGPHEPPNDVWFIATRAGREVVDREWDTVFPGRGGNSET